MALHRKADSAAEDDLDINPVYVREAGLRVPRNRLPEHGMLPNTALQTVRDELILDGNARLNLATFVTTWMEPQARQLMADCFDKNMIDKDEYPQTAELERRCVNILSSLWHAPDAPASEDGPSGAVGCSTTGSSEACMLGGMALLWRWRARRRAAGQAAGAPNLVMGSNVQVCWDKFCRYWDVEPRLVPMAPGRLHLTGPEAAARCDENTIGVVAVLGSTMDGSYEPVAADQPRNWTSCRPRGGWTSRSTSTARPAGSSRRSCTRAWSGISGWPGSRRSTPRATSTAWSTRASAGWCGGTRRPCPRTWCSRSTTWAGRCRRSR